MSFFVTFLRFAPFRRHYFQVPVIGLVLITALPFASAEPPRFYLSGYLPDHPQQRVVVSIQDQLIGEITPIDDQGLVRTGDGNVTYQNTPVLLTNSYIFPGLIDLHGHLKYHILPLWSEVRGQFNHRFEWRYKFPPYFQWVSKTMRAYKGTHLCDMVRYAEIKALTAGVTTIQGAQDEVDCAKDFGIRNVEVAEDWAGESATSQKSLSLSDFVVPDAMGLLFTHYLLPHMAPFLNLRLNNPEDAKVLAPSFRKNLHSHLLEADSTEIASAYQSAMQTWQMNSDPSSVKLQQKYLKDFEIPVKQLIAEHKTTHPHSTIFAHLAEGQAHNFYNEKEYLFALSTGLIEENLAIIHGMSLTPAEWKDAKSRGASLVWSPLSNLLLYGETTDLNSALDAGITIALGTDWSLTGSKNLLDELKIAAEYLEKTKLNKRISKKDLVDMVTINAAKILGEEKRIGKVAPGYLADLLLIPRTPKAEENVDSGWKALIDAKQEDIDMVLVGGQIKYANSSREKQMRFATNTSATVFETLDPECNSHRTFLLAHPRTAEYAQVSYSNILSRLLDVQAQQKITKPDITLLPIDKIYRCSDLDYLSRWSNFISEEWSQNLKIRKKLRTDLKLFDEYDPSTTPDPYDQ